MPRTKESFDALRALSALFLRKLLHPLVFMVVIVMTALYVLTGLLTLSFSAWWLLLLVILLPLTILFLGSFFIIRYLLQKLLPSSLSRDEQSKISSFIDQALEISDRARLPYPVVLLLVAKDVIRGKESKFLRNLIGDSKELMKEFGDIQAIFKK